MFDMLQGCRYSSSSSSVQSAQLSLALIDREGYTIRSEYSVSFSKSPKCCSESCSRTTMISACHNYDGAAAKETQHLLHDDCDACCALAQSEGTFLQSVSSLSWNRANNFTIPFNILRVYEDSCPLQLQHQITAMHSTRVHQTQSATALSNSMSITGMQCSEKIRKQACEKGLGNVPRCILH